MKTLLLFLLISLSAVAQNDKCSYICHNNKVVKAINEESLKGHLKHGDVFLGTCDDFTATEGDDCNTLSVPKFSFSSTVPEGLYYKVTDINGKLRKEGKTGESILDLLPANEVLLISIEGYQTLKFIKE